MAAEVGLPGQSRSLAIGALGLIDVARLDGEAEVAELVHFHESEVVAKAPVVAVLATAPEA